MLTQMIITGLEKTLAVADVSAEETELRKEVSRSKYQRPVSGHASLILL